MILGVEQAVLSSSTDTAAPRSQERESIMSPTGSRKVWQRLIPRHAEQVRVAFDYAGHKGKRQVSAATRECLKQIEFRKPPAESMPRSQPQDLRSPAGEPIGRRESWIVRKPAGRRADCCPMARE